MIDMASNRTAKLILFFFNTINEAKENQVIREEKLTIFNMIKYDVYFLKS